MPTAARLSAVIFLSLSSVVVIYLAVQTYPELEKEMVRMIVAGVVVAALVGWRGLGRRVGGGYLSAFGYGMRATVSIVFWTLFIFAIDFMIAGMMKHAWYEPMSAVLQIPLRMIEYGAYLLTQELLGSMVVLGLVSAFFTEAIKRRWD